MKQDIAKEAKKKALAFIGDDYDKERMSKSVKVTLTDDLLVLYKGLSRLVFEATHVVDSNGYGVGHIDDPLTGNALDADKAWDVVLTELFSRLGDDDCIEAQLRMDLEIEEEIRMNQE